MTRRSETDRDSTLRRGRRAALPRIPWLAFVLVAALLLPAREAGGEYGDVRFPRPHRPGSIVVPPAVFPHWFHRIRYRCTVCHTALFHMKAGAEAPKMDEMLEGKFCGACHDGKTAWRMSFNTCTRCHYEE